MSENQKQLATDIASMVPLVKEKIAQYIKGLLESSIEDKILQLNPDIELEDMDVTEKVMLLNYLQMSEEERKKMEDEAIPLEDMLKKAGVAIDEL